MSDTSAMWPSDRPVLGDIRRPTSLRRGVPAMSDPRVEAAATRLWDYTPMREKSDTAWELGPDETAYYWAQEIVAAVDAVSSQYEGLFQAALAWVDRICDDPKYWADEYDRAIIHAVDGLRRIESADTRALIDNRTPAETAEAKAWSDDAHARIRAGEVSGSHDLMREKVGEYAKRCPTCEARATADGGYACDCDGKHWPAGAWTSRESERANTQEGT